MKNIFSYSPLGGSLYLKNLDSAMHAAVAGFPVSDTLSGIIEDRAPHLSWYKSIAFNASADAIHKQGKHSIKLFFCIDKTRIDGQTGRRNGIDISKLKPIYLKVTHHFRNDMGWENSSPSTSSPLSSSPDSLSSFSATAINCS